MAECDEDSAASRCLVGADDGQDEDCPMDKLCQDKPKLVRPASLWHRAADGLGGDMGGGSSSEPRSRFRPRLRLATLATLSVMAMLGFAGSVFRMIRHVGSPASSDALDFNDDDGVGTRDFERVVDSSMGQSSECEHMGCHWMESEETPDGLGMCQTKCLEVSGCNVVNFCDIQNDNCPEKGKCCLRHCDGGKLNLVKGQGGWNVYRKTGGCWINTFPGCMWSPKCSSGEGDRSCSEKEVRTLRGQQSVSQTTAKLNAPEGGPMSYGTVAYSGPQR